MANQMCACKLYYQCFQERNSILTLSRPLYDHLLFKFPTFFFFFFSVLFGRPFPGHRNTGHCETHWACIVLYSRSTRAEHRVVCQSFWGITQELYHLSKQNFGRVYHLLKNKKLLKCMFFFIGKVNSHNDFGDTNTKRQMKLGGHVALIHSV